MPKNIRLNSTNYFIIKVPNKWELPQIVFNHSSDTDPQDFIDLYKKFTAKPIYFLVTHTTIASNNPLRFRKNFLERIQKSINIIDDKITDVKLQYDINTEAAKISALPSGKVDKYEWFTGAEILSSDQRRVIEQAEFTYSPLGKAFEKPIKTIENTKK